MQPSGIGPNLVRILSATAMDPTMELFAPGRVLDAEVVSVFQGRAVLAFGRGVRLEAALQVPLQEGQRIRVQVQAQPSGQPQAPGQPVPQAPQIVLKVLPQGVQSPSATQGKVPAETAAAPRTPPAAEPGPAPQAGGLRGGPTAAPSAQGGATESPPAAASAEPPVAGPNQPAPALEQAARLPSQAAEAPPGSAPAQQTGGSQAAPTALPHAEQAPPQQVPAQPAPTPGTSPAGQSVKSEETVETGTQARPEAAAVRPEPTEQAAPAARTVASPVKEAAQAPVQAAPQAAPALPQAPPGTPQILWLPIPLPDGKQGWAQLHIQEDDSAKTRAQRGGPVQQVRLWWDTPALGPVQVTLDAQGTSLTALFTAAAGKTRGSMEQALPELLPRLAAVGFPDVRVGCKVPAPGETLEPARLEGVSLIDRRL